MGRLRSMSIAGARRRYQRRVPKAIARIAERWGAPSKGARATSDERPSVTTEAMARAASARAGAPGAQGVRPARVSPKAFACELRPTAAREIGGGDGAAAWALDLAERQAAASALNDDGVVVNGDDCAWIESASDAIRGELPRLRSVTGEFAGPSELDAAGSRLAVYGDGAIDSELLAIKAGLGNRPRVKGSHLTLDLHRVLAPIDERLGLIELCGIGHPLSGLRHGL